MKKNESIEKVLTRDVVTTHIGQKVSDVRKLLRQERLPSHAGRLGRDSWWALISASDILGISVEGVGQRRALHGCLSRPSVLDRRA